MNRRAIDLAFPLLTAGLLVGIVPARRSAATGRRLDRPAHPQHRRPVAGVRPAALPALRRPRRAAGRLALLTIVAFVPAAVSRLALGAPVAQGGGAMNLLAVGCSFRTTPVELRERLAFDGDQLAARPRRARRTATAARRSSSAPATASSCTWPAPTPRPLPDADLIAEFLARVPRPARRRAPAAPVRPPRRRRGAAPVPRRRQPRQPDRRRGPDRRAGEEGLRAGPASAAPPGRCCTPCSSTPARSPSASAPRPASPAATSRSPAPPSITSARCSTTSATRRSWSSAPARWAS